MEQAASSSESLVASRWHAESSRRSIDQKKEARLNLKPVIKKFILARDDREIARLAQDLRSMFMRFLKPSWSLDDQRECFTEAMSSDVNGRCSQVDDWLRENPQGGFLQLVNHLEDTWIDSPRLLRMFQYSDVANVFRGLVYRDFDTARSRTEALLARRLDVLTFSAIPEDNSLLGGLVDHYLTQLTKESMAHFASEVKALSAGVLKWPQLWAAFKVLLQHDKLTLVSGAFHYSPLDPKCAKKKPTTPPVGGGANKQPVPKEGLNTKAAVLASLNDEQREWIRLGTAQACFRCGTIKKNMVLKPKDKNHTCERKWFASSAAASPNKGDAGRRN